jgi:hypothetical protein
MTPLKKLAATAVLIGCFFLVNPKSSAAYDCGQIEQCTFNHWQDCFILWNTICEYTGGPNCVPRYIVPPYCMYDNEGCPVLMNCGYADCIYYWDGWPCNW